MNILNQYSQEIRQLCATHGVRSLFAFGSAIRNDFNTESDIDLLVEFEHTDLAGYANNYFDLKFSLEQLLKHPIDLLETKAINNPYFKMNMERHMQKIYGH
jgi:predicted nucleotidyltransferase